MTLRRNAVRWTVGAAAAALSLGALAAPPVEVKSGGVGIEAREQFMSQFKDYNLHISFAEKSGAYLGNVDVTIRDAKGNEVWSGVSEGPILFARVPSGRYTVSAQAAGERKERTIQVGAGPGQMHYLHWNVAGVPAPALREGASAGK